MYGWISRGICAAVFWNWRVVFWGAAQPTLGGTDPILLRIQLRGERGERGEGLSKRVLLGGV